MAKIIKCELPTNSLLGKYPNQYIDAYQGTFISEKEVTVEQITLAFFYTSPQWINTLFKLRNFIVKAFGLKGSNVDVRYIKNSTVKVGQSFGLFKVFEMNQREIVLGEDDKHLNFRVSIYLEQIEKQSNLIISTTVNYHNTLGKIYFLLIKPFHKIVVKTMLIMMLKSFHTS